MSERFAIGVTGHRPHKLNPDRLHHIAADIGRVLTSIRAKIGDDAPAPVLVTSLAEGADTIAADQALAAGYELLSPIPFPAGHYARDFAAGEPLDDFRRLMGIATVFACTTSRLDLADETEGYIAASDAMLDRSQALLAVWDGEPTDMKGGAYDTMLKALARGMPVLWIDARGARAPVFARVKASPDARHGKMIEAAGDELEFLRQI
jgi:hypothetical protein